MRAPRTLADHKVSAIGLGGMPMSIEGRPDAARGRWPRSTPRSTPGSRSSTPPTPTTSTPTRSAHNEELIADALRSWGGDPTVGARRDQGRRTCAPATGRGPATATRPTSSRPPATRPGGSGSTPIGLYQFHRPDPKVPYAESVGAPRRAARRGRHRAGRHLERHGGADRRGRTRCSAAGWSSVQNQFSPALPLQPGRARALCRARHRVPAVEPARRHLEGRRAGRDHAAFAEVAGARGEPAAGGTLRECELVVIALDLGPGLRQSVVAADATGNEGPADPVAGGRRRHHHQACERRLRRGSRRRRRPPCPASSAATRGRPGDGASQSTSASATLRGRPGDRT